MPIQFFKRRSGQGFTKIDRGGETIDFNLDIGNRAQSSFRRFHRPAQTRASSGRGADSIGFLFPVFLGDFLETPFVNTVIEIFPSQMGITTGGLDLKHTPVQRQHTHVKRPPTQIKNHNVGFHAPILILGGTRQTVRFRMQPVGERRSGRLVNNPLHVQTRNPSGILGRLSLLIIEMRRNGNHRCLYTPLQMLLRRQPELRQHHGADFLRTEGFAFPAPFHLDFGFSVRSFREFVGEGFLFEMDYRVRVGAADYAFHVVDRVGRVRGYLRFGGGTYHFTHGGEGYPTWHGTSGCGGYHFHFFFLSIPACQT
mmetsp:Transcript_53662/g.64604  ORF Transcript_53662/g.64604 Transcript_53662/m.64604 type:complete len:311 (+) Transcript_53662:1129-2061(+)